VHATQRILCLLVIEFRNLADGLPRTEGVAILASHSEGGTMRATRRLARGLLLCVCGCRGQQQEQHRDLCDQCRNHSAIFLAGFDCLALTVLLIAVVTAICDP
jgi:hypothetical protein